MNSEEIIKKLGVVPSREDYLFLKTESEIIVKQLEIALKENKIDADVFIGGSFAKKTLVKKNKYDIDIFVRFDWKYELLTTILEEILRTVSKRFKLNFIKLHGSRDYFRLTKGEVLYEIIPVTRIKKPQEARNVTDLSYFHVNYVKNKINNKIINEIALFKTFCKANGFYGAESYIQGFSGYSIECLILYYKSFDKLLRELTKVKDRLILDPGKRFKDKNDIIINMNSSKLNSPIILVDPTWKERNVLAALNRDTFERFKKVALEYIKKPNIEFFNDKILYPEELKKEADRSDMEYLNLELVTNKQEGDIAGTKLKKFFNFLNLEINKYYKIERSEFIYNNKQKANTYLLLKSRKEITKIGPPVDMIKEGLAFRKSNKNVFVQNRFLHAKILITSSAKKFINDWIRKYNKKVKEMNITSIKVS